VSRSERNKIPGKKAAALVVDGECEKWYIRQLGKYESEKIHFTLKPELPNGKSLDDMYNEVKKLSTKGEYDIVFWIVDFDVIIKETKKEKKGIETKLDKFRKYYRSIDNDKIIIIINNPCLEYWFLQHYNKTARYFPTCKEVEKELKKNIKDYKKEETFYNRCDRGKDIYLSLKPRLSNAIANSKKLKIDFSKSDVKYYEIGLAEMYKLFEKLGIDG